MGKVTIFSGQPVYNQLLNLLGKQKICKISQKTARIESYVKKLDEYTHLVVMLYGVLKHLDSLRELEIGMQAEAHKLHHLGIDYMVRCSTIAEANKRCLQEFFAQVYAYLLSEYGQFFADSRPKKKGRDEVKARGQGASAVYDGLHHHHSLRQYPKGSGTSSEIR